jgi:hypothetical protein
MGEVSVLFCELCKAEITPATFSSPGASGQIRYKMCVNATANMETSNSAELCETCYGKVSTWLAGKQKLAADAWKTDVPAATTYNMPTI